MHGRIVSLSEVGGLIGHVLGITPERTIIDYGTSETLLPEQLPFDGGRTLRADYEALLGGDRVSHDRVSHGGYCLTFELPPCVMYAIILRYGMTFHFRSCLAGR